jgi:hypothetical protein
MTLPLQRSPTGPTVIGGGNSDVTAPATTAENTLASLVLPALSKNSRLRVSYGVTHTNGADDKIVKVKLGATALLTTTTTAAASDRKSVEIRNKGATNVQASNAGTTAAVETGVAGVVLSITGQKETGADSLVLTDWLVELIQLPDKA